MTDVSVFAHATNAGIVVYLLEWLKGTERYRRFTAWLPIADAKVHVLVSTIGALLAAVGMHAAATGSWELGWQVTVVIPPVWIMAHALWDWLSQLVANQLVFAIAVQRKEAAPVVTAQVTPAVSVTAPLASSTIVKE